MSDLAHCFGLDSALLEIISNVKKVESKLDRLEGAGNNRFSLKNISSLIHDTDLILDYLELTNPEFLQDLQS